MASALYQGKTVVIRWPNGLVPMFLIIQAGPVALPYGRPQQSAVNQADDN